MTNSIADFARAWLKSRNGRLTATESRVLQSTVERLPIARDISIEPERQSRADRIADSIARVGGSWGFILTFIAFLVIWTIGGGVFLASRSFDPYPFIFLNLILSMVAALQAPVIMMSQNRQAEHDRRDAAHDYEVNLKAEIEIMALHEKFDDMRHQDILMIRDQITALSAVIARLEARIDAATAPK